MILESRDEILVQAEDLQQFCARLFLRLGLPVRDAELVAECLVEADLRGVHCHGVLLMPGYVRRLQAGGISPQPQVRVVHETIATALLDGDNGMGQVVAERAMNIAIDKSRQAGMGSVGVAHSNHYGAGARWPMMALAHDMIGYAVTNAGSIVAPWGGKTALLGTNPWSIAIPAGVGYPIVLDMATSVVAANRLVWGAKRGEHIPLGWAVDAEGRPTTDPERGLAGRLLPTGTYKGYGLAVVAEILAGALTGASLGLRMLQAIADPSRPLETGHLFLAIDVGAFMLPKRFKAQVVELIRELKGAELESGVTEIFLPGELELRTEHRRRAAGVPLPAAILKELEALAADVGVPLLPWKPVSARPGGAMNSAALE